MQWTLRVSSSGWRQHSQPMNRVRISFDPVCTAPKVNTNPRRQKTEKRSRILQTAVNDTRGCSKLDLDSEVAHRRSNLSTPSRLKLWRSERLGVERFLCSSFTRLRGQTMPPCNCGSSLHTIPTGLRTSSPRYVAV